MNMDDVDGGIVVDLQYFFVSGMFACVKVCMFVCLFVCSFYCCIVS